MTQGEAEAVRKAVSRIEEAKQRGRDKFIQTSLRMYGLINHADVELYEITGEIEAIKHELEPYFYPRNQQSMGFFDNKPAVKMNREDAVRFSFELGTITVGMAFNSAASSPYSLQFNASRSYSSDSRVELGFSSKRSLQEFLTKVTEQVAALPGTGQEHDHEGPIAADE